MFSSNPKFQFIGVDESRDPNATVQCNLESYQTEVIITSLTTTAFIRISVVSPLFPLFSESLLSTPRNDRGCHKSRFLHFLWFPCKVSNDDTRHLYSRVSLFPLL